MYLGSESCSKCSVNVAKDVPIVKVCVFLKKLQPQLAAELGRRWVVVWDWQFS